MSTSPEVRSIFISYRRDDSGGESGRLFDDLTRAFGSDTVFMDVAGIEPGVDFRKAIDDNVSSCGVLLAVIGPEWLTIAGSAGTPRLQDPDDFVRLEISSALKRGIPVIPVLVHSATMPHADALPDDLKDLAYRNGVELTLARWNSDVALLVTALGSYVHVALETAKQTVHATVPVQLPAPDGRAPQAGNRRKLTFLVGAAVAALALISVAIFLFTRPTKPATAFQVTLPYNAVGITSNPPQDGGIGGTGLAFRPFVKLQIPGTQTIRLNDGTVFAVGAADSNNVVQPTLAAQPISVTLPAGPYSALVLLATGVNGVQSNQPFTVTYDDSGPNPRAHTQSVSDWQSTQPLFANEKKALVQNQATGQIALYEYSFQLDKTRNLKSFNIPANNNLIVVGVTVLP